ncbi:MAG TPA: homoserine kinase [Synergistales bacterium]|nr:homoserine kinase [Synergistales bacterium]
MRFPIRIRVPASSANLGSGFDTLGLALSLYNFFDVLEVLPSGRYEVEVIGEGSGELETDIKNQIVQSYEKACAKWGINPLGLRIRSSNAIPLARGLGSSSTAIVGGVMIANLVRDVPLSKEDLLPIMVDIEGHPDNVVPCCLGGMVVSCLENSELRYVKLPRLPSDMVAVVAVPDFKVSTEEARNALPRQVPLEDAVFNISRAALLAASWATGKFDNLPWGMSDRIHQPFRSRLFPGGETLLDQVNRIPECSGSAISGSGPSIIAFASGSGSTVAKYMCSVFSRHGLRSRFFVLDEDYQGATLEALSRSATRR